MKIVEILNEKGRYLYKVNADEQICKVLDMFREKKIGSAMVTNSNNEIIGIMTEKDAIKCFKDVERFSDIKIKDIMTHYEDIIIASENDDVQYAMSIMT